MKKRFLCPYCLRESNVNDVLFKCSNPNCNCIIEPQDHRYHESLCCPEEGCGELTFNKICPLCHESLPDSTFEGNDILLSIIGSVGSGKSNFIGVLIKELKDRICPSFDMSLEDDAYINSFAIWQNNFGQYLYSKESERAMLAPTETNIRKENEQVKPMIFNIKQNIRNRINQYTCVFYDAAGEDLQDTRSLTTANQYLYYTNGIILLLDPVHFIDENTKVKEKLIKSDKDKDDLFNSRGGDNTQAPDELLDRVSDMIRKKKGIKNPNKKIDIPIAIVMAKFDFLIDKLPANLGMTVLNSSLHCKRGKFEMSDANNVSNDIETILRDWNAMNFIKQISNNFSNYKFFGVSALGNMPNHEKNIYEKEPNPHRIEDPILWLFKQNKIIP